MPCFKYAVADGVIPRNPMDKIVLPKYDKRVGMPLTREEERHLLDELQRTAVFTRRRSYSFCIRVYASENWPL